MTIRVGMIGTGGVSNMHGNHLKEISDVEIVALADPNEKMREAFASRFDLANAKQFDDYHDLLQSGVDAVVICSPHTLHYEQVTHCLNSGVHVLVEKPMVCSSDEATKLIATAEKSGKVLQVSYQRHAQPEFIYIKEAIENGDIGKLTSITASLYQGWRDGTAGKWRQAPELSGGGMLMDSGSHILDVVLWTSGLTPKEVKATLHSQGAPVEIDSFTSIQFEEGAVAGVNILGHAPKWHETYVFVGEEGGIFYDNGKIRLKRNGEEEITPELPPQTTNQDQSFIDAILGRSEVLIPPTFAEKVVQLTEKIYQSAGYKPY